MEKCKKFLVFISMMLITGFTASAFDFMVDGLCYAFIDGKSVYLTYKYEEAEDYYSDYSGDIIIPQTVTYNGKTYTVTSIGWYAFSQCRNMTSVTIPNSVTYIGESAFQDCTGLTSVTIPNSVTYIGSYAFNGCSGLTSITIPNSVTTIGSYAFGGCSGLTSVTIPNSVTSIGDYAFSGCSGLTGSLTIPNSVTSIGSFAFNVCSGLTSVTIPNSVTSIGSYAFERCSGLTSIKVASGNTKYDSRNNCNAIIETSTNSLIAGCKNTTIPNSVTEIGDGAFKGCSGLTSVTIPNSVTSIGHAAFSGCSGLTSVTIPNSVTSIGGSAFYGCSGLTSITIPSSVTSMGNSAFEGCSGLKTVNWNAKRIADFTSNTGAFKWQESITTFNIGNGVEKIPAYLCYGLSNITNITIPNSVTYIGSYAFNGCSGLTGSLTIPNSVTSIGGYAFSNCIGLTSVTIPNSVTSIGHGAFKGCSGLTSVTIPNSVTSIGGSAFYGCSGLTSITIPNSVTEIGDGAFKGCSGLTSVTIPNSVTSIGGSAFYGCSGLTSVTIPNSVTSIGYSAFRDCSDLTSVTIPNSVTSIGGYAFSNCIGLTSINIPNSVTSIGDYAFSGCSGLQDIYSEILNPATVTKGTNIFQNVPFSTCTLHVPAGTKSLYQSSAQWKDFKNIVENNQPATSISLNHSLLSLQVGNTATLVATILPTTATNKEVTWTSSNTAVATVSNNGVVTAKSVGTAAITARTTDGTNLTASCTVTVNPILATSVTLNKSSEEVLVDEYVQLTATVLPSNTTNKAVTWKSGNTAVATVDENGKVKGIAPGTATITVTTADGSNLSASCTVTVLKAVGGIMINQATLTLNVGETETLTATVTPADAANQTLLWSSSNSSVATVDQGGLVTAKSIGEATITVAATDGSGVTATCLVNVVPEYAIIASPLSHTRGDVVTVADLAVEMINRNSISGLQFDLWLPQGVTLATIDDLPDVWLTDSRKSPNHSVGVSRNSDGSYRVLVSSPTNRVLKGNDGVLLHLNLIVPQYHQPGVRDVRYTGIILAEPDETQHRLANYTSKIDFNYLVGDADADAIVDVADYTTTALHILNRPTIRFYEDAANVNGDYDVNVTDLIGITNIALGIRPQEVHHAPAEGGHVESAMRLTAGEDIGKVAIGLTNSRAVAGMQFDLILPDGVNIERAELVGRAARQEVEIGSLYGNRARVLVSAFTGNDIADGEGDVLRLTLSGEIPVGCTIQINDITITERNLTEHHPESLSFILGTTAVNELKYGRVNIWTDGGMLFIESPYDGTARLVRPDGIAVPLRVNAGRNTYSMRGQGIAIVTMDGTTRKVILK